MIRVIIQQAWIKLKTDFKFSSTSLVVSIIYHLILIDCKYKNVIFTLLKFLTAKCTKQFYAEKRLTIFKYKNIRKEIFYNFPIEKNDRNEGW